MSHPFNYGFKTDLADFTKTTKELSEHVPAGTTDNAGGAILVSSSENPAGTDNS